MRGLRGLLGFGLAAGLIGPALAADWGDVEATLSATSDYRFHSISQNDRKPALQGEVEWSLDGWHIGAWSSMIDFNDHQNTLIEVDVTAGKQVTLRGAIIDFEVVYYSYPIRNRPAGAPRYSFLEGVVRASYSWGDLTLSAEGALSPNYFGETGTGWHVGAGVSYQLRDWLSASANIGRQWVEDIDAIAGSGLPYTHWDAGLTATYDRFSLDVRYVDTDLSPDECLLSQGGRDWCAAGGVATLSYATGE